MTRSDLPHIVEAAVRAHGGQATLIQVARYIWEHYEQELRSSGDLFYTWQYDMRWAAYLLRKRGRLKPVENSQSGMWELATGV